MSLRLLLALFAILAGSASASAQCDPPSNAIGDWPLATPESVALDGQTLCTIASKYHDLVHAVLVARHGKLVFERYFTGTDETIGQHEKRSVVFDATTRHDIRSITKSITSLVLGIAIDRGLVRGTDSPVLSYFPDYAELRGEEKNR